MTDVIVHVGAEIDPAKLEADARAEVARKQREGVYPPELLREVAGDRLRDAVEAVRGAADLEVIAPTDSRRRTAALAKRVIARALRWHTRWEVDQVRALGGSTAAALAVAQERIAELERRLERLEKDRPPSP